MLTVYNSITHTVVHLLYKSCSSAYNKLSQDKVVVTVQRDKERETFDLLQMIVYLTHIHIHTRTDQHTYRCTHYTHGPTQLSHWTRGKVRYLKTENPLPQPPQSYSDVP